MESTVVARSAFFFTPVILVGALLVLFFIVLIMSRRRSTPPPPTIPSAPPLVSPEDRQAILQKLADGELTKAETEEQLNQLGDPVPVAMPAPPPRNGATKGCLIALLLAIIIPLLFIINFFLLRVRTAKQIGVINQRMEQFIQENHGRNL